MTEQQHKTTLIKWSQAYRNQFPELKLLHHIPNGGTRNAVEGKHLKQAGVRSGVPDLCLPVPRGGYHGLYIELKRSEESKPSKNQKWWLDELIGQGYCAIVCEGWEMAADMIVRYLGKPQ